MCWRELFYSSRGEKNRSRCELFLNQPFQARFGFSGIEGSKVDAVTAECVGTWRVLQCTSERWVVLW